MIGSLFSGISGLNASTDAMAVIGDNIANVNTTGFKSSSVSFGNMFSASLGESNSTSAGDGVKMLGINQMWTSGSFENTGNATDLAINGKGLFVLENDSGAQFFTRAGNFTFDDEGYLISSDGYRVQGYEINEGGGLDALGDINIAGDNTYKNQQTSMLTLGMNLDSGAEAGDTYSTTITINDSLGNDIPLTLEFTKVDGVNEWEMVASIPDTVGSVEISTSSYSASEDTAAKSVYNDVVAAADGGGDTAALVAAALAAYEAYDDNSDGTTTTDAEEDAAKAVYDAVVAANGAGGDVEDLVAAAKDAAQDYMFALEFDSSGKLVNNEDPVMTLTLTNGAISGQEISLDLVDDGATNGNVTGYPADTMINSQSQDGYPAGILLSVSVDNNGVVTGSYSNGQLIDLYRVALADFPSYSGLTKMGNNLYSASKNSGQASIGIIGTGRLGTISSNSLEMSNVDLAKEFVKMITTQRAYQANSRVISTSDELLTELINIKR